MEIGVIIILSAIALFGVGSVIFFAILDKKEKKAAKDRII